MRTTPLACPVRHCGLPLARVERSFVCPSGHTHDIARSGYVNLLQPQDRRSAVPGDSRDAVEARARLSASGTGAAAPRAIARFVTSRQTDTTPVVVDLGAGTGDLLGAIHDLRPIVGVGIDLSAAAALVAARRWPSLTWLVANVDRRLPLLDGSVDVVLSVHARRNPPECARVMARDAILLVAVPAADDLAELRDAVQGEALQRERTSTLIAEHAPWFEVQSQWTVRDRQELDAGSLADVLRTTYRGQRTSASARAATLDRMQVTFASDVVVFVRKR